MSAFLSFPYADRVEMLTDGATCLPSGRLIAKTTKVKASERLPMAITGRGRHVELEQMIDWILSLPGTVDEVLGAVAWALQNGHFGEGAFPYEVIIGAISERDGPNHYFFRSEGVEESPIGPIKPFTLYAWGDQPLVGGCEVTAADLGDLRPDAAANGLKAIAVPLFDAMRRKSRWTVPGVNQEAYWIGAHIDHAVIRPDGVTIERIHEWPDEYMQLIQAA